jgi:hypothetical protein
VAVGIWPSHQRDDMVTAWAGLDVQRDMSPTSSPLAFFTFMMLLSPVTKWEPCGVTLAGYCYTTGHGMKVQIVTLFRVSHLQRYSVIVRGNVTTVYPPLLKCMHYATDYKICELFTLHTIINYHFHCILLPQMYLIMKKGRHSNIQK